MKQVTELRALPTKYREPDETVIAMCEEILAQALSGELQSIDAVCSNHSNVWTNSVSSENGGSLFGKIGAHHCLMSDMRDRLEDLQ